MSNRTLFGDLQGGIEIALQMFAILLWGAVMMTSWVGAIGIVQVASPQAASVWFFSLFGTACATAACILGIRWHIKNLISLGK